MNTDLYMLIAAIRAYDAAMQRHHCPICDASWDDDTDRCRWCETRRQSKAATICTPPARRGYGYATAADLAKLGIDPEAERVADLRVWGSELRMAVESGLVTMHEADVAFARQERAEARHETRVAA